MTKRPFPKDYARLLAEKAMDLANLALAGIVFVQFVPGQNISSLATGLGVVAFLLLHIFAYYTMPKGGDA